MSTSGSEAESPKLSPPRESVRNRWLWPVAGLLILFAIFAGSWYFLESRQLLPAAMAEYFPERESTTLFIDVDVLRASGVLEKLVGSTVAEDPEYRTFIQQTGFDYKRDLNRVMMNSAGGIHYFLLEGRFDWPKLESFAKSQGGTCKPGECHLKGSTPDRVISWRRMRKNRMALASARDEAGARAIERRAGAEAPFTIPAQPAWLHLPGEAIRSTAALPAGTRMFAKAMESGERAVFALGPEGDQFQLSIDVACRTPEDAAILKAQLESLTKLLTSLIQRETKKPSPNDLSGILTSGTFERSERHVLGRWPVRRAFIDSLGGN